MTKAIEKSVGRALLVTARLHRSRMGERLNGLGLFPGQEQALKALQPAPMTMGELAALLRVKPPTVSKTIGRLSLQGLVTREAAASGDDMVVVFERPPSPPIRSTVVEVAHAPRARANSADDEIVRRLREDPQPGSTFVVTSDRRLADMARAEGAAVVPAETFRSRLEAGQ